VPIFAAELARPLQYQTHRELVNRALQFHERSQHFIGAHDETLSVICSVQPSRLARESTVPSGTPALRASSRSPMPLA